VATYEHKRQVDEFTPEQEQTTVCTTNTPDSGGGRPPFEFLSEGGNPFTKPYLLRFVPAQPVAVSAIGMINGDLGCAVAQADGTVGEYRVCNNSFAPVSAYPNLGGVTIRDSSGNPVTQVIAGETYTASSSTD
jgi:hypothetical protein